MKKKILHSFWDKRGSLMREFMTVKEAAEKWNISERQVQILCKNNRIAGIERIGRNWIIQCKTKKVS